MEDGQKESNTRMVTNNQMPMSGILLLSAVVGASRLIPGFNRVPQTIDDAGGHQWSVSQVPHEDSTAIKITCRVNYQDFAKGSVERIRCNNIISDSVTMLSSIQANIDECKRQAREHHVIEDENHLNNLLVGQSRYLRQKSDAEKGVLEADALISNMQTVWWLYDFDGNCLECGKE